MDRKLAVTKNRGKKSADTGCNLNDFPRAMSNRDRLKGIRAVAHFNDDDDDVWIYSASHQVRFDTRSF